MGWTFYDNQGRALGVGATGATGATGASGSNTINIKDEGVSKGSATTVDFVGSGVSASVSGGVATVTISGGTGTGTALTVSGSDGTSVSSVDKITFSGSGGTTIDVVDDSGGDVTVVISSSASGLLDQGSFTYLDATEAAAPSTPGTGKVRIYAKADGRIYSKDDAGTEYGPFDAASEGGTSPQLANYANALHADGDEFDDDALTGWTLGGSLTTSDVTAVVDTEPFDGTCLDVVFGAAADRMVKDISLSDNIEVELTTFGYDSSATTANGALAAGMGVALTDDSGNGRATTLFNDGNVYLWGVSAWGLVTGTLITTLPRKGVQTDNCPIIVKLKKVGTTLTGSVSADGDTFDIATNTSVSTTMTKMAIGRFNGGGVTNPRMRLGRFNVYDVS